MDTNKKTKPLRILHVLTAMNRAGTETMLMNLYRAVDRSRIQFDFAATETDECDYDEEIKSLGGKIIHYPKYKGVNHFIYVKWWDIFFKTHFEYRIVHGHIGSTAAIYLKIAKKYGLYTIAHSHSTSGGFGLHKILYSIYSYPTRYIADYFMGCSTEALMARYGKKVAENHNINCILKNGIDVNKYSYSEEIRQSILEEYDLSQDTLIIGTVGRLTAPKNPFFILDILYEINRRNIDFVFLWAGTGELKEEIKEIINNKELNDKIKLLGVRNDIPRILQVLNVFILPSKFEGLPVIGVEVQAAQVPMLCSDKVSPEINLSDCCKFLSISSVEPWVEDILKERNFRRIEGANEDVIKSGYDIRETSKWLMEFYECKV